MKSFFGLSVALAVTVPHWLKQRSLVLLAGVVALTMALPAMAASVTYAYDEIGRLKTATYDDGTVINYQLDAPGNRTNVTTTLPANPGVLQWNATTYAGSEGGATVSIVATRTGGTTGAVSATYSIGGTATNVTDYSIAGTLSWAAGDAANKTLTVTIVDDALIDPNETVVLTMSAPTGGATLGSNTQTTLTITDNDVAGTLQLSASTYSVAENGGSLTITVTRASGSAGAASVNYATSNGTATSGAGNDYTATSGTLNWAAGDAANKTFNIPILDDASLEGNETFTVTLSGATGATLGSPSTATVTITDWENGTLSFSSVNYGVVEGNTTVVVTVTRTGGTNGAVAVNYATSNGTATAGAGNDYTATSGTLNWAAGDGASKTFTVTILDDAAVEVAETINLALSGATGGAVAGGASVITITDNDSAPTGTLQLSSGTYAVAENGGSVTITVTRAGGSSGPASISYATSNGTASAGSDYTTTSGALNWATGDAANKTFTIPILDDSSVEGDETINVTLSGATGATLGSPATGVVTINDVEPGTLQLSSATYSVGENGGSLLITVTRANGSTGAASINYATSNGTAAAGSDYTATSGTLNWAAGNAANQTFSIPILDDASVEGNETFTVTLSGASGAALGSPSAATVTITDWENGTLSFSQSSYSVTEANTTITATVTRTGGTDGAVGVGYITQGGYSPPATIDSDYVGTSGTLNWGAGDGASKTITVTILDDGIVEGTEGFLLRLQSPFGGATTGTALADVVITDNPAGSVQLVSPPTSIAENGGSLAFTVSRTGGSEGPASVLCSAVNGTAAAGSDFTNPNATLTWAHGDAANKTCTVPLLDDTTYEGDETFTLQLSGASGAALGSPNSQGVTIAENDPPGDTVTVTEDIYSDPEFSISLAGAVDLLFGAFSPQITSDGKTYNGLYDAWNGGNSHFSLTGMAADPGQNWLVSITCRGTTMTGSGASYNYSPGYAVWNWSAFFGFTGTSPSTCTIVHN